MCGIVYMHDLAGNPVNNAIMQQFDLQRTRGTQGFGLFDGQEKNIVRATSEDKILKWLVKYDSDTIMFHHRWPTSTINVKKAAHPFSTKDYFGKTQYVLVHNGVISNPHSLKLKHQDDLGITYQSVLDDGTFNDSEALLWDLALTLEGKQKGLLVTGSIAFICMKLVDNKLEKLYFGRNSNPLNMKRIGKVLALSSEGEGEPIEEQTLYTYNYKLNRLTKRPFTIPRYATYDWQATQTPTTYTPRRTWDDDMWDRDIIDYDHYGNPIYEANQCVTYGDYEQDEYMQRMSGTEQFQQAVDIKEWRYMLEAQGNFDSAYTKAEEDYLALPDDDHYNIMVYEEVLENLFNNPEWVDEDSISSEWGVICDQMKLA